MEESTAYLRIYEQLREEITGGIYPYGRKIPSKRSLADMYDVSVITVEHALALLAEEGYIEKKERSGCYVIYRQEDLMDAGRNRRVRLDYVPAEGTFPYSVYVKAVRKVLNDYGEAVMQRTEGSGSLILRQAISAYLLRCRSMNADPGQIVIGSGAEYLYGLSVQMLGRYRIYGIEDPCYEKIRLIYRSSGVRLDPLKMGENGILSSELERTPASVLHVTPYYSYPSGKSADASKRNEYIRWAQTKNAWLIEDDYASEFAGNLKTEKTLFARDPKEHVIYINSFTRTIAPSIRIAYMILPETHSKALLQRIQGRSCTVSTLSQLVLAELLNSGSFERHINRLRRRNRKSNNIRK